MLAKVPQSRAAWVACAALALTGSVLYLLGVVGWDAGLFFTFPVFALTVWWALTTEHEPRKPSAPGDGGAGVFLGDGGGGGGG